LVPPARAGAGAGPTPFELAFVDFGMMTTIPERLRQGLREFAIGLGTRDARRIVDAYVTAGTLLPEADLERLVEAHEAILARFWGVRISQLKEVALAEARHLAHEYRDLLFEAPIQVQADMLFALRAVGILAGLCTTLDPDFDPWSETLPFAERLLRDDSRGGVIEELGEVARALLRAPAKLDRLLAHMERGGMAVKSSFSPEARERLQRLERALDRLAWFVAASGLLVAGAVLRDRGGDGRLATALLVAAGVSLLLGLWRR
ncbi:MAG: AarF/ABC1/UbiB kinase family protein, partial [Acidobacteriota bacterium]